MRGLILALATACLFCARPAEAYLDPGTGSYVFQMVAAAIVSVGFVARAYWDKVRGFLARFRRPAPDRPPDER